MSGGSRTFLSDFLQAYPFWLFDVAPFEGFTSPSLPALTPLFGFATVSGPKIIGEVEEIREGNYFFTSKVLKRASCSNIKMARGVAWYDSDFWRWLSASLRGSTAISGLGFLKNVGGPTYRRDLVLVHFFSAGAGSLGAAGGAAVGIGAMAILAGVIAGAGAGPGQSALKVGGYAATTVAAGAGAAAAISNFGGVGPFEFTGRIPAKAFVLSGCIPVRWKGAGDYDAKSGEISLTELEVAVNLVEEIALLA